MLQEQLTAARREASQLQAENEELREAHLEQQSALQVQPGAAWLSALRSVEVGIAAGLLTTLTVDCWASAARLGLTVCVSHVHVQRELSSAHAQLDDARQERDQLRQRLAKVGLRTGTAACDAAGIRLPLGQL